MSSARSSSQIPRIDAIGVRISCETVVRNSVLREKKVHTEERSTRIKANALEPVRLLRSKLACLKLCLLGATSLELLTGEYELRHIPPDDDHTGHSDSVRVSGRYRGVASQRYQLQSREKASAATDYKRRRSTYSVAVVLPLTRGELGERLELDHVIFFVEHSSDRFI